MPCRIYCGNCHLIITFRNAFLVGTFRCYLSVTTHHLSCLSVYHSSLQTFELQYLSVVRVWHYLPVFTFRNYHSYLRFSQQISVPPFGVTFRYHNSAPPNFRCRFSFVPSPSVWHTIYPSSLWAGSLHVLSWFEIISGTSVVVRYDTRYRIQACALSSSPGCLGLLRAPWSRRCRARPVSRRQLARCGRRLRTWNSRCNASFETETRG